MGWFDWLFGRKKKAQQSNTRAAAPPASKPVPTPQDDEDDDQDFAEATTFISRRLSPVAQREIKTLRDMLARGVQSYDWKGEGCRSCSKFLTSGPFRVGDGLTGQAPVPGREGAEGCQLEECNCTIVAHEG